MSKQLIFSPASVFRLLCLCLLLHPAAHASGETADSMTPAIEWLRDAGGAMTIDQARAPDTPFTPLADGNLSAGYTRDVVWLRLRLPAFAGPGPRWLAVPPSVLDDVRLYLPDGGRWQERRGGDHLPFARRGPYRSASFELPPLPAGSVVYLRIRTSSIMAATPRLWDAPALQRANDRESLGNGMYLGLMAGLVLFSLIGWFTTRQRMHGLFALFVACIAVRWSVLDGLAAQYLFPEDASVLVAFTGSLLGLNGLYGALFQIWLLQLRGNFPWLLRYYQCAAALAVLVIMTPLIGATAPLSTAFFILLLLAPLLSVPAYLRLWRGGALASRLVALVMPLYFLVMLPSNLAVLALTPFSPLAVQVAHLAELLLMLALHASIVLRGRDAERERNAAQGAAAEALSAARHERHEREEQARFLAMITHEVRTPVALIDAAAHSLRLLDECGADPSLRASRYVNIGQAVGRMKSLMELTELHGRLAPCERDALQAPFDLRALTDDAIAALAPQAVDRVVFDGARHALPALRGDARLLYFSLLNLLDNAVKYADPGTPIRIAIGAENGGAAWRIRDQGRGVPADLAEAIFEKYRRLDEAASQPGLGLGLPLARQIVERHGGHLRLDPGWRGGAAFVLWLPQAA